MHGLSALPPRPAPGTLMMLGGRPGHGSSSQLQQLMHACIVSVRLEPGFMLRL